MKSPNLNLLLWALVVVSIDLDVVATSRLDRLMFAIYGGRLEEVKKVLRFRKIDVNLRGFNGQAPLTYALEYKREDVARYLIERCRADVNLANVPRDGVPPSWYHGDRHSEKNSPLHVAVQHHMNDMVTFLLDKGADCAIVNAEENTPMHFAAKFGRDAFFVISFNWKNSSLCGRKNVRGQTPLLCALHREDVRTDIVERLLDWSDVKVVDNGGNNVFHYAATWPRERLKTTTLLLAKGGKWGVNEENEDGNTPLLVALEAQRDPEDYCGVAEALIEAGADVGARTTKGIGTLYLAEEEKAVRLLARNGADVNAKTELGLSPLHKAIMEKRPIRVIRALLEEGAEVNAADNEGNTVLHIPGRIWSEELMATLISWGVNLDAKNKAGDTPLTHALRHESEILDRYSLTIIEQWRRAIYQPLLDGGADVNIPGGSMDTAAHLAVHQGNSLLVGYLVEKGADVNAVNISGENPMIWMLKYGLNKAQDYEILYKLIAGKIDVNAVDYSGKSALYYAHMNNYTQKSFDRYLIACGALE